MSRTLIAFRAAWGIPGRWFWPALWCLVFLASLWLYRHRLAGGIEDYDPSRYFGRDSYRLVVVAARESPWPSFTSPFLPAGAFYRPGSTFYFWINRRLVGVDPLGWRLMGLAWHAACITLLGVLAALCAGSRTPGVLAALWFSRFGAHDQAVNWIGTHPDLVAAALSLACVIVLWRGRWRFRWRIAASAGLLLAALLTKESAAFVPIFLAISVWLWPVSDRWKQRGLVLAAAGAVSLVYLGAYRLAVGDPAAPLAQVSMPTSDVALRAYGRMLWPPAHSLRLFLPTLSLGWTLLLTESLWRMLGQHLAYYGGAVLLLRRAWPPTLLFALWLIASPLPAFRSLTLGERYFYLASMGWAALAGLLIWQLGKLGLEAVQARRSG